MGPLRHDRDHHGRRRFDIGDRLGEITAPTLVVGGGRDRFYPSRLLTETAQGIPNARLVLYENRAHGATFAEPEMVFYFYERLGYSTTQFGLLVGGYCLAMVAGQTTLGGLSDRFGRRPVIAAGFALNSVFFLGLATFDRFGLLLLLALSAGLGNAPATPALSASYLDITEERYRSSVLGIKESATALGAVAGPLLVAFVSPFTTPGGVFATSGIIALGAIVLSLFALRGMCPPERVEVREELPKAATTLHCLTCTTDDASDAVPVGTASVAGIDEQITMSTTKEELP